MINIKDYRNLKLKDVAMWEVSRKDKEYPKGCSLVQVSATKGEVEYLTESRKVDRKYAVVIPNKDINPKYLNIVIKRNIDSFIAKYRAGLNIQMNDLKHLNIQLHNRETQNMIAKHVETLEREEENIKKEIQLYNTVKSRFLKDLLM